LPAADGCLMPQPAPANGEGGNGLQRRRGLARWALIRSSGRHSIIYRRDVNTTSVDRKITSLRAIGAAPCLALDAGDRVAGSASSGATNSVRYVPTTD